MVYYCRYLIKQWGLSSETSNGDSTISVTYPITFSVFNVVVPALYSTSGHKQHEGGGGDGITKSDNMSKTFNFPVSFSNNCFVVLPVLYGSWAGCVVWARFKDLTKCTLGFEEWANNTQGVHVGYLAIGN